MHSGSCSNSHRMTSLCVWSLEITDLLSAHCVNYFIIIISSLKFPKSTLSDGIWDLAVSFFTVMVRCEDDVSPDASAI